MLPDDELDRPPRLKKGGAATKDERDRIETINALAKTFGVDVYLWFSETGKEIRASKPFFLSWKKSIGERTQKRFYQRIEDAEKKAHRLISSLPSID